MACIFSYAFPDSQILSVRLPSPTFENEEKVEFDRINRKTTGGDLIIFRDPEWTETTTLNLKFIAISEVQKSQMLYFFEVSLGLTITLQDWEGYIWNGFIINPGTDAITPDRTGLTLSIEFQGSIVGP